MPLTVLNVAYPLAPVGPDAIGGAEQVLGQIDAALVAAGHRSIVIACEGSRLAGTLLPTARIAGELDDHLQPVAHARHRAAIASALARWPVDVMHFHGIDFHAYLPDCEIPTLVTLHLPPTWYAAETFRLRRHAMYIHCVSASQRRFCPEGAELLPEIPSGVPVDELTARHGRRRFVFAMGRICWEKGFHVALDAAKEAGVPMLLAGQVFDYAKHRECFEQLIQTKLDGQRRFIGPVGFARKRRLLSAARAVLVPSLVPETGSLVAMEALACGTPVIAFRMGVLPDIIDQGVTGFIVDTPKDMADAIRAADQISPDACREAARARFSLRAMTDKYLDVYSRLAAKHRTAAAERRDASYAA